jgi:pimeloyl-ACP methyl ester carboxylesterase
MHFLNSRLILAITLASPLVIGIAACASVGVTAPPQLGVAQPVDLVGSCADVFKRLNGIANTNIMAVENIAAGVMKIGGSSIDQHCLVKGKMFERVSAVDGKTYAIGFEMRLPKNWNGRFFYQANGGIDGVVQPAMWASGGGPVTNALHQGFAVLSSDTGHGPGPSFGIDPQARLDYGYQAVAKLTPMAKGLLQSVYGKGPDRSYIGGCSNGGRHALVAASRMPEAYDGYLIGAPGYRLPLSGVANMAGARLYQSVASNPADIATGWTQPERTLVANAVVAKCDALDGAADGIVSDYNACQKVFNLERDVQTCTAERNGACLSAKQKTVLTTIFSGTTTSDGKKIYSSFPFDAGLSAPGVAFWEFTASLNLDSGSAQIWQTPPTKYEGFNGPQFALTTDIDKLMKAIYATDSTYTESAMNFMTPPNPTDLRKLQVRGAKVMSYHGVSDAIFSVTDSEAWFDGIVKNHGDTVGNFARLYAVPGMGHCQAGPATDQFDMLMPLVNWVERGQAPQSIVATTRAAGNAGGSNADVPTSWSPLRSRPLCPYPSVARYSGAGSLDFESSYSCKP